MAVMCFLILHQSVNIAGCISSEMQTACRKLIMYSTRWQTSVIPDIHLNKMGS